MLLTLESGARPKGGATSETGEIPSIGAEHLADDGGFKFNRVKRIPRSFFKSMKSGHIATDDILIVKDGATTGKTSFVTNQFPFVDAAVNEHVFRLCVDAEKAYPRYVFNFLRSPLGQAGVMSDFRGATVGGISRGFAGKIKVPLPVISEQIRLSAILDQTDTLRTKRREALAQLDSLTQSIFIEMFGDPATNPKKWTTQTLGEVTLKITDGEHLNPVFSHEGMPMVMAGNVLEDGVDLDSAKRVETSLGVRFRKKCNPEIGDLLVVSRGATIGRMCAVRVSGDFCLMGSVILIKVLPKILDSTFLSGLLKHPVMKSALFKASGSSAQQAIYLKDLKTMSCMVPPLEHQQRFSEKVTAINKVKAVHRASIDALDTLFASLQHRAFQGEL